MLDPVSVGSLATAKAVGRAAGRYASKRAFNALAGSPEQRALQAAVDAAQTETARELAPGDRERRHHLETLLVQLCRPGPVVESLVGIALEGAPRHEDVEQLVQIAAPHVDANTLDEGLPTVLELLTRHLARGLSQQAGQADSPLSRLVVLTRLDELKRMLSERETLAPEHLAAYAAIQAERMHARLVSQWIHTGPSVLESPWRRFMRAPPWDAAIRTIVQHIADLLSSARLERDGSALSALRRACAEVDLEDEYRIVAARLAALQQFGSELRGDIEAGTAPTEVAKPVLQAIEDLNALVSLPRFGRCMLVAGSSGEGKTHFVAERLRRAADDPEGLVLLLLDDPRVGTSARELLRDSAEETTGRPWNSWVDLAEHVDRHGHWLVIAVDGVDRWAERDPQLLASLEEEIARSTRYDSVRWLVTADLSRLDRLIAKSTFWTTYGWVDESEATSKARAVDGWHILDPLNVVARTGIEILRSLHPDESTPTLVALADRSEPEIKGPVRRLSVPFTAWLTHEVSAVLGEPLDRLLDISSLALLSRFTDTLVQRTGPQHECTFDQFQVVMALAADVLAREPSPDIELGRLIAAVVRHGTAEGSSVRRDRTVDAGLEQAMRVGLLTFEPGHDAFRPEASVRLRYEFVWEWLMAGRLMRRCGNASEVRVDQLVAELVAMPDPLRRERVTELALLMADEAATTTPSPIWESALDTTPLPESAVWFAAARARRDTQTELLKLAQRERQDILTRRTTFALLHFLGDAGLTTGAPATALAAMSRFYADFGAHELGSYFEFLVERLLGVTTDRRELLEALNCLVGSEVAARPFELATIAGRALHRLCPTPRESIELSLAFLRYAGSVTQPSRGADPLGTFHNCYVHQLAEWTCQLAGVDAYLWFRKLGWYDGENEPREIAGHMAHRMRTEANTALGAWYRHSRYGFGYDPYLELIARLVPPRTARQQTDAADPRDRINAIYLMLHIVPKHARSDPRIDERFHPYLRILRGDPDREVQAEVHRQRRLFETNLDAPRRRRQTRGRRR